MKKYFLIVLVLIIPFILTACGESVIDLSDAKYEPKIVFDAYIFDGQPVNNIHITRNFPLNQTVDVSKIILYYAEVSITDMQTGKKYPLTFDVNTLGFKYSGNDLIIAGGKSYKLEAKANVDGKELYASSVTTVPMPGFRIIQSDLGILKYRDKDANGNVKPINFDFVPTQGSTFYALSIKALDAELNTFIYDNAFFEADSEDVKKDFDRYRYQDQWIMGISSDIPQTTGEIEWLSTWFYGKYRMIMYAADRNFHHFKVTHQNVQEPDGNFHEPAMYIEGDGIGVFGSAVVDTLTFEISR